MMPRTQNQKGASINDKEAVTITCIDSDLIFVSPLGLAKRAVDEA